MRGDSSHCHGWSGTHHGFLGVCTTRERPSDLHANASSIQSIKSQQAGVLATQSTAARLCTLLDKQSQCWGLPVHKLQCQSNSCSGITLSSLQTAFLALASAVNNQLICCATSPAANLGPALGHPLLMVLLGWRITAMATWLIHTGRYQSHRVLMARAAWGMATAAGGH